MNDLTRFTAALYNLPLLEADAIAVFCGEDCLPRLQVATQLFAGHRNERTVVALFGGLSAPPRIRNAEWAAAQLMGLGVSFDRIKAETASQHTRDQSVALAKAATEEQWSRVLLVASAYHMPRAYLTALKALAEAGITDKVHLVPVAASQVPWFQPPEGADVDRMSLYGREVEKLTTYTAMGHCATAAEGLAYLRVWDGR